MRNEEFKPGLILVRDIAGLPLGKHYGIWVAVDEVIHASKTDRVVVCDTLKRFSVGLTVEVSSYSGVSADAPEIIIARARAEVGKWPYELMDGNCEAFVLWCLTGTRSPGLQMGVVKLLGELADDLVIKPARAAKARTDSKRELAQRVAQILLENHSENEEARLELEATIDKAKKWRLDLVMESDRLEEMFLLNAEYQAVLDRADLRHDRRIKQHNGFLSLTPGQDDLEMIQHKLEMVKHLMVAEQDWRKYESGAVRDIRAAARTLRGCFDTFIFEQIKNGGTRDKIKQWTERMHSRVSVSREPSDAT